MSFGSIYRLRKTLKQPKVGQILNFQKKTKKKRVSNGSPKNSFCQKSAPLVKTVAYRPLNTDGQTQTDRQGIDRESEQ